MVKPANQYRFLKQGIGPEIIPLEKDLIKFGRRVKSLEKKIASGENFSFAE